MGGKLKWILAAVLGLAALAAAFVLPKGSEEEDEDDPPEENNMPQENEEENSKIPVEDNPPKEYRGYVPEGCQACGGPYPLCRDGCNAFDD